ncbi:MAG: hypothetical protein ACI9SC_000742 [Gammaproteobacteria bacterium]|jgi:hypothetical protein
MKTTGHIRKMVTSLTSPVQYQLPIDDKLVSLNDFIGKSISLHHSGEINCVSCGSLTKKSFNQGHCYRCFISLASCDMCIMKPETCHYHLGTCREPEWGETHCMQHHYIYLANSSGIKVGITRGTQIPTRWIDQGATQALPIFRVSNRLLSGKIEVAIKAHVSDRTDWRKMLKAESDSVDLLEKRDELIHAAESEIQKVKKEVGESDIEFLNDAEPVNINYPIESYPEKVKSLNFDKTPEIEGVLNGIKGQYLILNNGVLNIRKFAGYHVNFA